ncbi:uncharacterized protein LODBEIA_P59580 [Lodderomyces beijingensis]|uniref:Uncharacterized protein n=1 Tax=Lodderomyces beijingensis TaxID=1775926 RepID=A0ABP0ZUZ1_9ASCO
MTLTKYQRGDITEGWNDCPTPVMLSHNNSYTSLDQEENGPRRDRAELMSLSERVFAQNINLPERELKHYKSKIETQIQTMDEKHLSFLERIFVEVVEDKMDKRELSKQIVQYMMGHEGVTVWCSPLKKIVNSLCSP